MRRSRNFPRGFTLVELMVSLVAGAIIAIAVVGLSRTATNTFHEQVRLSAVEGTLRSASERLRNDLLRAGFMTTGNIKLDNSIAHTVGGANAQYAALADLQGIKVIVGGSKVATEGAPAPGLATRHNLNPDTITITGNLTSDDSYRAQWVGTGSCGGARLLMDPSADSAVLRMVPASFNAAQATAAVQSVFTPGAGDFAARVMDKLGCYHFALVCASGWNGTRAFVDLRPAGANLGILTPPATGNDTCGGRDMEEVSVSPVHRANWALTSNSDARLDPDPQVDDPANKFNLTRQLINAAGAPIGAAEIIAEYAIDLKFGLVVDDPTAVSPNNIVVYDLDSDPGGGSGLIDKATLNASATTAGQMGPQRVRAVRYRLSVRAPIADRQTNMILVAAGSPYIARYCIDTAAMATCKRWARVRTLVSEVALTNQARFFY